MSILQQLYDSEINATIGWFWDSGFDLAIGDTMNGFKERGRVDTWEEVEVWLADKAIEHYPDSDFAKASRPPKLSGDRAKLDESVQKIIDGAKPA